MHSPDQGKGPITHINVIPLVDIILVVLIIFMATAPMISRRSVRVDVPKAKHQGKTPTDVVELLFTKDRSLFLEGRVMETDLLKAELRRRVEANGAIRVLLSADQALPYGEIMTLLDDLKDSGLRKISLEVARR